MRENLRLCRGLIKTFLFVAGIKLALIGHRISPASGDWLAERFGINAAHDRAHRWFVRSDRREDSAEPSSAWYASSDLDL
jgi:hypothetical protein